MGISKKLIPKYNGPYIVENQRSYRTIDVLYKMLKDFNNQEFRIREPGLLLIRNLG